MAKIYRRKMKLVKEFLLEFERGSDPKNVLGIGKKYLIENWMKAMRIEDYTINYDLTIDIWGNLDLLKYPLIEIKHLPEYIQFNHVNGFFDIGNLESINGIPNRVEGSIFGLHRNFMNMAPEIRNKMRT